MNNESDDEGFLNEAEVKQQQEAKRYQQEQVQWIENGEKRNYESIVPLSIGPELDDKNHASWVRRPRFCLGLVLVVVALILVVICREALVSPPMMQEPAGIVAEDASRHKHKTRYPTTYPTQAPLPTFLPTLAPFPTLVPTEAPSPTIQPSDVEITILPITTEEEPSMLPTEASSMVLIEDASRHKRPSAVPTMISASTSIPTLFPTVPPVSLPSMYPTEVPIPTMVPTVVPSIQINSSPITVINHLIGGVTIVGLFSIGVLYGLYYWGWLGNKTADDGHFVALK